MNKKQQDMYDQSIPFKNLKCDKCNNNLIYISKEFIDWWKNVFDRCLFMYKCNNCNNEFKIYSDWGKF